MISSILKTTGKGSPSPAGKRLRWKDGLTHGVMLETKCDTGATPATEAWIREIVSTSASNIADAVRDGILKGKTGLKGTHKICRPDLIRQLYTMTGKEYTFLNRTYAGLEAAEKVIKKYCHRQSHVSRQTWCVFLTSQFSIDEIDQATNALTLPLVGDICIIPKDPTHGADTYATRIRHIGDGWDQAKKSSMAHGRAAARTFLTGTPFIITSEKLALDLQQHIEETADTVERGHVYQIDQIADQHWRFSRNEHVDISGMHYSERQHIIDQVTFWLRWNEWTKFEKIVMDHTDFVNHPTEFDFVYGRYWRAVNATQLRFDEIYEKDAVLDGRLVAAKVGAGKMIRT